MKVVMPAQATLTVLRAVVAVRSVPVQPGWLGWCGEVRTRFPWIGPEHADKDGFINSYRFMEKLVGHLKRDHVIVTDMGTALLSGTATSPSGWRRATSITVRWLVQQEPSE